MRVITGRFRGRKVLSNAGQTTRPITDRAKEMLFENLGGSLTGGRVADIFSGTGTIGLEALSRGADRVTFIEKDPGALALLRKNVTAFDVQDETVVWPADVLRCSFRPRSADSFFPFDLIFFDPPYPMVSGIAPGRPLFKSLQRLARDSVTAPDGRLVLRTPEKARFTMPDDWQLDWNIEVSNMTFGVYHRGGERPDSSIENDLGSLHLDDSATTPADLPPEPPTPPSDV